MDTKPKHRWYQFSLRTMFVGVTLVCVGMALAVRWVQKSQEWIEQRHEVLVRQDAIDFSDDYQGISRPRAPGGMWLFGEKGASVIVIDSRISNATEAEVKSLFPEARVSVSPAFVGSKF